MILPQNFPCWEIIKVILDDNYENVSLPLSLSHNINFASSAKLHVDDLILIKDPVGNLMIMKNICSFKHNFNLLHKVIT